jgi:hypothetical protein
MRYVLALMLALSLVSPALAGKHGGSPGKPSPAKQQEMLDKVRAAPAGAPGLPQGSKDHIINTILRQCPSCS